MSIASLDAYPEGSGGVQAAEGAEGAAEAAAWVEAAVGTPCTLVRQRPGARRALHGRGGAHSAHPIGALPAPMTLQTWQWCPSLRRPSDGPSQLLSSTWSLTPRAELNIRETLSILQGIPARRRSALFSPPIAQF